jgi:hypothetical protein
MKRLVTAALLAVAATLALGAGAAQADTVWLCKPGMADNPCRDTLKTTIQQPDGSDRVVNPPLPAHPPVDCFYVYPTVSQDPGTNADKDREDAVVAVARYQASRFSSRCRVFAPIYRQLTLLSIAQNDEQARAEGFKLAYADVLEAWRTYLRDYNHGRGFVIIGHSQGTRVLRKLVREEIDRRRGVRRRMLSALMLGGNVLVRDGKDIGGDFQRIPACHTARQLGCVIAYSTFNYTPPADSRFGREPLDDPYGSGFPAGAQYEVLCTNPGSLRANRRTPLKSLVRTEPYPGVIGAGLIATYRGTPPDADTAWVRPRERYTGRCVNADGAHVLMLESIGDARELGFFPDNKWGQHLADVNIALGQLVGIVARETRAYLQVRN